MDGFAVGFAGDAVDKDEIFENLADFAVMHELETVDISHAVAETASEFDHFGEVCVWIGIINAGVLEILDHKLIGFHNHAATDGFAGKLVGDVLELVINGAVDLRDGIIEKGKRGFREDDGGDTLGVALGIVAEFGDLLFGINFGEFVIMKLSVATLGVGVDVDGGEKFVQTFERAEGNCAVFGDGVMIGVDFDEVTPVDAVGNSHGKEEYGMAGEFGEARS